MCLVFCVEKKNGKCTVREWSDDCKLYIRYILILYLFSFLQTNVGLGVVSAYKAGQLQILGDDGIWI